MKIILLGDIAFTGIISTQPEKNKERFKEVIPILNSADLVFANLEVPVKVDDSKNEYKNFIHYSLPGPTKDLLKSLNIGCVSLANNHIYDCKMPGLEATINILDETGIYHTGAGWLPEHIEPVIINKDDSKIAFLAYVDKSTNPKTEYFPELLINYFDPEEVISDIQNVKDQINKVVISIHWGVDYSFYPMPRQIDISRNIVDAGADIIMGHHPHTMQPYEIYKGKPIFYSLGQLCFGDSFWEGEMRALKKKTKIGMLVSLDPKNFSNFSISPTKEQIGNYIELANYNIERKLRYLFVINRIKNKSQIINWILKIKETFWDRIYEYFFGYYRNPLKQLFNIKNIYKIKHLFRDYKNYK